VVHLEVTFFGGEKVTQYFFDSQARRAANILNQACVNTTQG
jgi:hypothetical protein